MLTLLAAPSGVGLTEAVTRLEALEDLDVFYVEREMLADDETWGQGRFPFAKKRNMRDLLYRYTRRDVRAAWSRAFRRCAEFASDSSSRNQVIAFHPSLYAKRRSEEYSTIEWLPRFERPIPSQLVLLIDDIYDMWARLGSERGELFYQPEWLDLRLQAQDLGDAIKREGDSVLALPGQEDLFNRLVLDSSQAILSRLLSWRHVDMIEAETLAFNLDVRLTVLGTKHPFASLRALVTDPDAHTTYLSHPISRPRTTRRGGDQWPAVVAQSNALSPTLVSKSIALICPTAIDELRFQQPDDRLSVHDREFALDERWPLIVPAEDSIGVRERPSDSLVHIPIAVEHSPREVIGSIAKSLESQVFSEVPFRDHYLVSHTQSFFVFRPLYGTGAFSDGVRAEIEHWADLRRIEHGRHAMFAHAKPDVVTALESFISSLSRDRVDELMKRYLRLEGLNDEQIHSVTTGEKRPVALLDSEALDPNAGAQLVHSSRDKAVLALLFSRLTGLDVEHSSDANIAVSLMAGEFPTDAEAEAYADFLKTGQIDATHFGWRDQLSALLGKDPVEWVEGRLQSVVN